MSIRASHGERRVEGRMPLSRQQALEVIRRLTQLGSLDMLGRRLAPRTPEEMTPPPDVPRPMDWSAEAREQRLAFIEHMGVDVPQLAGRGAAIDPAELRGNIEQYIGMTQIPTGLIGPIRG